MGLETFIKSVCVQTAVYWGNPQPDGRGGYTFDEPVEIGCRWDQKIQVIVGTTGKEIVSKAEILVTQDIDEEGFLFLGSLTDLDSDEAGDPQIITDAWEVLLFIKSPFFKSTSEFTRQVFL